MFRNGADYRNGNRRDKFKNGGRDIGDDSDICGVHLTVREHRDGAMMLCFAGIRVEKFVKLRRGGEQVQKEDERYQQTAERQFAPLEPNFILTLQSGGKLAQA
jgi:hypothetical protein